MNDVHLHLIVNHASLFALLIGALTLAAAMKRKSVELRVLATVLFVLAGVFACLAFTTGEQAEAMLKALGGSPETFIDEHAQAAVWAQRSGLLVACLALMMEWTAARKQNWLRAAQWVVLVFALHGCSVFAATSFLGGKIRHTDLRAQP